MTFQSFMDALLGPAGVIVALVAAFVFLQRRYWVPGQFYEELKAENARLLGVIEQQRELIAQLTTSVDKLRGEVANLRMTVERRRT